MNNFICCTLRLKNKKNKPYVICSAASAAFVNIIIIIIPSKENLTNPFLFHMKF